jgi:phosphatidate phosphatase APP1
MANWKDIFFNSASAIEEQWDDISSAFKLKLGLNDPVQIVPFRSYGTANRIYLTGRVLEDKKITSAGDKDGILDNLVNMYKRFESDEVPGSKLNACIQGEEVEMISDIEGYFVLNHIPQTPIIHENLWHFIPVKLMWAPIPFDASLQVNAEVMIPPLDAEYGIISDIDDTVIKTAATSLLAMGKTVLLANARTRLPFAGVSEFYKALQLGRNGKRNNPFFYVSSSPWNMYDLLKDFLDLNEIPGGPILLRDIGFGGETKFRGGHMGHKFKEIKQILETYPNLQFVLVGDSGQEDPVIYKEVVKQFPGRILSIYIRDVQLPDREKIALDVSKSLLEDKVEMLIVDNTEEAAKHAAKIGLIYTEAIPAIVQDKKEDKGQAPGKEDATVL